MVTNSQPALNDSTVNIALRRKCLESPHYSMPTWQHCYGGLVMGHSTPTMGLAASEKFGRSWVRHTMRLNIVINLETKSGLTIRQT